MPTTRAGAYNQRPRRWPSSAPGAMVAQAHWHGNSPTPCAYSCSDAVDLTREAAAGRAMSTLIAALNDPPCDPKRTPTARSQEGTDSVASGQAICLMTPGEHGINRIGGRQRCMGVGNLRTPMGGSLPQCGPEARGRAAGPVFTAIPPGQQAAGAQTPFVVSCSQRDTTLVKHYHSLQAL